MEWRRVCGVTFLPASEGAAVGCGGGVVGDEPLHGILAEWGAAAGGEQRIGRLAGVFLDPDPESLGGVAGQWGAAVFSSFDAAAQVRSRLRGGCRRGWGRLARRYAARCGPPPAEACGRAARPSCGGRVRPAVRRSSPTSPAPPAAPADAQRPHRRRDQWNENAIALGAHLPYTFSAVRTLPTQPASHTTTQWPCAGRRPSAPRVRNVGEESSRRGCQYESRNGFRRLSTSGDLTLCFRSLAHGGKHACSLSETDLCTNAMASRKRNSREANSKRLWPIQMIGDNSPCKNLSNALFR